MRARPMVISTGAEENEPTLRKPRRVGHLLVLVVNPSANYWNTIYWNTIVPNVPTTLLLGPAVKNSVFVGPLAGVPPPKSIAQSWSM